MSRKVEPVVHLSPLSHDSSILRQQFFVCMCSTILYKFQSFLKEIKPKLKYPQPGQIIQNYSWHAHFKVENNTSQYTTRSVQQIMISNR